MGVTMSVVDDHSKQRTEPDKAADQRLASFAVRAFIFLVPAITGFAIAFSVLELMSPFPTTWELVAWFAIALIISLVASMFVGEVIRVWITHTAIYKKANSFDTAVEELFGSSLRDGNAKAVKKEAVKRGLDTEFVDDVIMLLDHLGRHEKLTRGHSERVRAYSSLIGKQMGLSRHKLEQLNWTALLHDIGKLDVPARILTSPDKPTQEEWESLQRHPAASESRLDSLEDTLGETIYHGALYHHERWDGSGYPHGLAGTEIPLYGRIVAVADVFDVMTHARSYKTPQPVSEARKELLKVAGTQLDPEVVDAFIRIGDDDLKAVRGWSATFAGISLSSTRVTAVGSQAATAVATVVGAVVASSGSVTTVPAAIAFEPVPSTTTASIAPTTSVAPTTTESIAPTTTTTVTTTTTTEKPVRLLNLTYEIVANEVDGVNVELGTVDRLDAYLNGELDQSIELVPGQRLALVTFDVTDLARGPHPVRFELFSGETLVSTDETAIIS